MFSFQGASSSNSASASLRFRLAPKTALRYAVSPLKFKPASLGFEFVWLQRLSLLKTQWNLKSLWSFNQPLVIHHFSFFIFHFSFFISEVVGQSGLEPPTSRLSVVCSSQLSYWPVSLAHFFCSGTWWRLAGSNRWPPACKAGALPAELNPHIHLFCTL